MRFLDGSRSAGIHRPKAGSYSATRETRERLGGAITGEQRHRFAVRTTVSSYPQDAPIFQTGSDTGMRHSRMKAALRATDTTVESDSRRPPRDHLTSAEIAPAGGGATVWVIE
jgi:hypothetical protein